MDRRRAALIAVTLLGTGLAVYGLQAAIDPGALGAAFAAVRWEWIVLSAVAYAVSQTTAGLVWRVGLSAGGLGAVGRGHAIGTHWMARGAGELLPAQLGEGVRVATVRRHPATSDGGCARIAGSLGAYKLIDGIGNFAVVGLLTLVIPLPGPVANLRWIVLGVLAGALTFGLIVNRVGLERATAHLPRRVSHAVENVVNGAALLGDGRRVAGAFALHGLSATARIVSLGALLLAFGLPFQAALLVFAVLVMASLIPISPGGVGVREAALVPALVAAYGLSADSVLAFSLSIQATVLAVSLLGGLIALAHHHTGLRRVRALPGPAAV